MLMKVYCACGQVCVVRAAGVDRCIRGGGWGEGGAQFAWEMRCMVSGVEREAVW